MCFANNLKTLFIVSIKVHLRASFDGLHIDEDTKGGPIRIGYLIDNMMLKYEFNLADFDDNNYDGTWRIRELGPKKKVNEYGKTLKVCAFGYQRGILSF